MYGQHATLILERLAPQVQGSVVIMQVDPLERLCLCLVSEINRAIQPKWGGL